MRKSGILLPIFSLPSRYGIGCFSREAYEFVDFLAEAGQSYWQILPLVPPGAGESPYQSESTFAGNPYFIDLEKLVYQGLLSREEIDGFDWGNSNMIEHWKVRSFKSDLLWRAFERSQHYNDPQFSEFCERNNYWLYDYADYMSHKEHKPYDYYLFEQFTFDQQWRALKGYANYKGIKIIGDIPLYVSMDSVDVHKNPWLFQLNDNSPRAVAGCPPDAFSEDGQVWGNPLYDWEQHRRSGYDWWVKRIRHNFELYDVVRIDHFRGLHDYFSIPAGDWNAKNGHWEYGPDMELFDTLNYALGHREYIAEDLGIINQGVRELLRKTGMPGMKILQFAFNEWKDNPYLPENINENSVVYTGTHDNNTALGWYKNATDWEREHLTHYIGEVRDVSWQLAELAMSTRANLCIIQMQDFLGLDEHARINTPGTMFCNWKWKMIELPTIELAYGIRGLTEKYNRR